ncbi:MAG: hypothetical protein FWG98_01025 [Candidatus Cloacimonetes bacterium]|nr:hypothetical protein [Candidatus Cloacimonadota bacterium]
MRKRLPLHLPPRIALEPTPSGYVKYDFVKIYFSETDPNGIKMVGGGRHFFYQTTTPTEYIIDTISDISQINGTILAMIGVVFV